MLLSIDFPAFIAPEIIHGLPFRWYGLMYIFAFGTAYLVYRKQVAERHFPMNEDTLSSMFFWCIVALLLGARLFSTIIYEAPANNIYFREPWLIFWPFRNGQFTGLQGMSYHGGALGGALGIIIWSKCKGYDLREIGDMYACAIPAGYTFGRLGNFFNQELYGRVTTSPLGMIFPACDEWFSPALPWVREVAEQAGIALPANGAALVNLPRYPTQLFEAFFEGIVLFLIMMLLRKHKPFKGFLFGAYLFGYGLIRFILEYFRQPDVGLGYRLQFGAKVPLNETARFHPMLSFSTGQLLSLLMMAVIAVWWIFLARAPNHEAVYYYPESDEPPVPAKSSGDKKSEKNSRRNLRNKLK
jgi:phosphatidylglycerol:prolipoprotein diacylglycerol transferase